LSGIRQGIAIGCFAYGTYLLGKNVDLLSLKTLSQLFRRGNLKAVFFLVMAPLFHTTALFALVMLVVALFLRGGKWLYVSAIAVSFVICVSGVFEQMGQILETAFFLVSDQVEMASRYGTYVTEERMFVESTVYEVIKGTLPMNGLALLSAMLCNRKYTIQDRLFFWMVIVFNLFYYFSYMFRLIMYLYPAASVAAANMIHPSLREIKEPIKRSIVSLVLIVFVLLSSYVAYVSINIFNDGLFQYRFCF